MSSASRAAHRLAAPRVVNIDDLRQLARRRLPRVVFDYIDGGAEGEVTLRENRRAFESVTFRPRHAVAVSDCDLRTTVLGTQVSLPFLLAPVGSSRMFYPRGEVVAAHAASVAGTAYVLSTFSGCRLEEVSADSTGLRWYQIYLAGGRDVTLAAIERARAAGFTALVVTIDTPVAGLRERDVRNSSRELSSKRIASMLPYLPQLLARPRWLADFLRDGGLMQFPNVTIPAQGPMAYADVSVALEQAVVTWKTWSGYAKPGKDHLSSKAYSLVKMPDAPWTRERRVLSYRITAVGSSMVWRRHFEPCRRC